MPFCSNCGAAMEGRFCGKCGATAGDSVTPAGAVAPPPAVPTSAGLSTNAASAISYVLGFITGILFLVLEPYNRNKLVRFHAFQSIFLSVACFAVSIVLQIFIGIMAAISYSLVFILSPISMLFGLAIFGLWLYLIWKTYQGVKVVLPIIGPLAEKQA